MTSRDRILAALSHKEPDRLPLDFGATLVTGLHVSCVAALRRHYGLEQKPVRILDLGQMLGTVDEDLRQVLGTDAQGIFRRGARYGFPNTDWKPWRMPDGLEVIVPGRFNVTIAENGDILTHPLGDTRNPPSAKMPVDGYFFDNIERQQPIDDDHLNPADNLEEFQPVPEDELDYIEQAAREARATGRAVAGSFGGTALGDISQVPGPTLPAPKGIRSVTEWYISTRSRRDYIHKVFQGQCEIAIKNLERIATRVGNLVDVINVCGTDFGTQASSFCSVATFNELWAPYYLIINNWIHQHTSWKTFKHSCGAVEKFIPALADCGFDILNPVQCSAAGMDPETLKQKHGDRVVFWGGGIDTQKVLPFGTPAEVREQVLRRCEIFARGGGFVFNAIHNVQARTPVENIVAMIDAVHEFNGR
jgi:uroporphyrinogen-III decarboxylase